MIPTHSHLLSNGLFRTSLVLCAFSAAVVMAVGSGKSAAQEKVVVPVVNMNASECLVLDASVVGSSAGQASIKAAPTTWSSRSNVRWNARWSDGRYLV